MDHRSSTQSGTRIGSSEDLLTEIFIRLPATSILRFKSVCKHWRLLLTNSHFTHRYDNNNNNNNLSKSPGLFASNYNFIFSESIAHLTGDIYVPFDVENPSTPSFGSLDFNFNHSNVKILHSCNGLLLCYARRNHAYGHYVFNPTTKQLEIIPSVPKGVYSMALAFHQTHCMHYKVVCILDLTPYENFFQIQVYSSDTRKWKICIDSYFESFYIQKPIFRHPVYWNGAVYWAPSTQNNLLYFKLDAEKLQKIPFPAEMMSYETKIMYFGESRGRLHLIFHTIGEEYILRVNVYEMMTDHSGWFVKYQLQLDTLLRDFPCLISQYEMHVDYWEMEYPFQCDFRVIDVVRDIEEEDTFSVLITPFKMIRYNIHNKSFKELYGKGCCLVNFSSFHRYIETLSSF